MAAEPQTLKAEPKAGPPPEKSFSDFLKDTGMPSPDAYEKKGDDLLKESQIARKPFEEKQETNIAKMFDLAKQLQAKSAPAEPKLQDLPEAPDSEYRDPMQSLGSLASALAMFASLKTRAPLTSALNAASASMQGFRQGDQERVKLERGKWRDNLEAAIKQNQVEMNKYEVALKGANFDLAKARPMFEAIAAENDHTQMLVAAQQGDYKMMHQIMDGANRSREKLADMYIKDQEKRLQIKMHEENLAAGREDRAAARAQSAGFQRERIDMARERMEDAAAKKAEKAVAAGKPTERALEIIDEMRGLLSEKVGITGLAGMVRRPLETVVSTLGGSDAAPAHKYESLARELQNILRQTEEFRYKGRTLSKEVADRDVMVRGLKFGDTDAISMDQLSHLQNMLTGGGASFEPPGGAPAVEPTATNPKTGEKLVLRGGAWQPVTP